jgi:hypothetical protein
MGALVDAGSPTVEERQVLDERAQARRRGRSPTNRSRCWSPGRWRRRDPKLFIWTKSADDILETIAEYWRRITFPAGQGLVRQSPVGS